MSEKLVFELQAIDRATAPLKAVQGQLDRTTAAVRRTNSEYARAQAGTRNFGMMAGQVGFQIQDFAVQVANGTSAITAFGQQAPQVLGLLGPKGAILGAVVAIGAAILGVSAKTSEMSFNFQKFAADIGPLMKPVMFVFNGLKSLFSIVSDVVIGSINGIINGANYLAAAIGALPSAFEAALGQISMRFRAFGLDVQAGALTAQAAIQDLRDALSFGSPEAGMFESGTMAENLREMAAAYSSQADAQRRLAENSKGFGQTMSDALSGVKAIDLRDYFEQAGTAAEEAGNKAGAAIRDQINPAAEEMKGLGQSIKDSMSSGFMSMVDGTKSVKDAFKDMARNIIAKLYEVLVVQRLVNGITSAVGKIFPGIGSALGFLANGGTAQANRPYIVGERGPELMVPGRTGAVIPNDKLSGGGGVTVVQNINISTGVQQTVRSEIRSLMPQIAESAKAAVFDAQRRSVNGMGFA